MSAATDPALKESWRGWLATLLVTAIVLMALVFGFVVTIDPFGLRVRAGDTARPIMDINQRYMYPQLVRSQAFDSAIFGTSTMRLVDPAILSGALDRRVVNLAMNAATPWEQTQMAALFARATPSPRAMVWGIDTVWCSPDATAPGKRLTPRPFPPWLYDSPRWSDWPRLVNLTTLEIAVRLLGHRLGLMPERIRGDGYEVFTPPESEYDLERAQGHLFERFDGVAPDLTPIMPPEPVSEAQRAAWTFPALDWLDGTLAALPASTAKLIVLPPVHLTALPREGSAGGQRHDACKAAIQAVAVRHGAKVVDYAYGSAVTRVDANYWDPLHFRLAVARRMEADLIAVLRGEPLAADGVARLLRNIR